MRKKSAIWNHKHYNLIHVDPNIANSIVSIKDSANICEKKLSSPVPSPKIFPHGTTSDPPAPSHESSEESVTPKANHMPRNSSPNAVSSLPADPDSDQSFSYSYLSDSSDSSDDNYSKIIQHMKK